MTQCPLSGLARHIIATRQTVLINDHADEQAAQFGMPAGRQALSSPSPVLFVPIIVGDQVARHDQPAERGPRERLQRLGRAPADDARQLMSVALENARLFDETQRLLKETEERNAELAIITSVQQGLASKLEMQAIYDLVGDKIREIFDAQVVGIVIKEKADDLAHFPYVIEKGERFYHGAAASLRGFPGTSSRPASR